MESIIEQLLMTDPQVVIELLLQQRIEHPVFAQMMLLISKDLEAFVEPEQSFGFGSSDAFQSRILVGRIV